MQSWKPVGKTTNLLPMEIGDMSNLRQAAQQALEALEEMWQSDKAQSAITALRAALADPEHDELRQLFEERYVRDNYPNNYPSVGMERISSGEYVSPKLEREWQEFLKARTAPTPRKPLTRDEVDDLFADGLGFESKYAIVREIERAHGIGEQT